MAIIEGKGLPTTKTLGAVGDTYIDTDTKKKYECTFAYREGQKGDWNCQWRECKNASSAANAIVSEPKAENIKAENTVKEESAEEPSDAGNVDEKEPVRKDLAPKRTNYTQYSKKNK